MAHLIDKDALVAEIRSRLHPVVVPHGTNYDDWDRGADSERLNILSIIDALEVKEMDLESEMDKYFETMEVLEHENIFEDTFQRIAKHFFELGLKAKQD